MWRGSAAALPHPGPHHLARGAHHRRAHPHRHRHRASQRVHTGACAGAQLGRYTRGQMARILAVT